MAKHSIIVKADFIKACAMFASTDASRPILGGINFCGEGGNLTLACTDSYSLIVCDTDSNADDFEPFTLDAKALAGIKAKRSTAFGGHAGYIIEWEDGAATCNVTTDLETWTTLRFMEQKYPNFRQILPKKEERYTVEPCVLDPAFLERVGKALRPFAPHLGVSVATRRNKATCIVAKGDGFKVTALVMPKKPEAHQLDTWEAAPVGDSELTKRIASLEAERDNWKAEAEAQAFNKNLAGDDCERLMRENKQLLYRIEQLEQAQPAKPHEWESKTLRWFDHEVEGATLCKKESSPNFGCWFIKKQVATA